MEYRLAILLGESVKTIRMATMKLRDFKKNDEQYGKLTADIRLACETSFKTLFLKV